MKTLARNGRVVFIVFSVLQFQENKEHRLVNSLVNSIVVKCLETLLEHEPPVNEKLLLNRQIALGFELIIKNCGNSTVFIVLTVSIVY